MSDNIHKLIAKGGKTHKATFELDPTTSRVVTTRDSRHVYEDPTVSKPTRIEAVGPVRLSITGDVLSPREPAAPELPVLDEDPFPGSPELKLARPPIVDGE